MYDDITMATADSIIKDKQIIFVEWQIKLLS